MEEEAAAEQNSVILSQIWEDPQGSDCRTEAAVSADLGGLKTP